MTQYESGEWDCEELGHFELRYLATRVDGDEVWFCLMCDAQVIVKPEAPEDTNALVKREFGGDLPL